MSSKASKQFTNYLYFISSIKRGDKIIIFGPDYIVLSKKAYDALINTNHPELESFSYDDSSMHDWIRRRFLEIDKK